MNRIVNLKTGKPFSKEQEATKVTPSKSAHVVYSDSANENEVAAYGVEVGPDGDILKVYENDRYAPDVFQHIQCEYQLPFPLEKFGGRTAYLITRRERDTLYHVTTGNQVPVNAFRNFEEGLRFVLAEVRKEAVKLHDARKGKPKLKKVSPEKAAAAKQRRDEARKK